MKRSTWTQVWPAYAYAILVLFLGSIRLTEPLPESLSFSDKYQHCIVFAVFEFLAYRAVRFSKPELSRLRGHAPAILMVSLAGAGLEVWQFFIPWRSCEFLDWVADTVGALGAAGVAIGLAKVLGRPEH